ncbi:MAG: ATP-binding protein [Clostridia bacterium]
MYFNFVRVKEWEKVFDMLLNGEVDIVAPVEQNISTPMYAFTTESIMYNYQAIMSLKNRDDLFYNDFEAIDNAKVGIVDYYGKNKEGQEYLESIGCVDNLVEFKSVQDCEGALRRGEIDAFVSNIMDLKDDYKILARFQPQENVIAMRADDKRLLKLNSALSNIRINNHSFQTELYEKYYAERTVIPFTKKENEYISSHKVLNVAVVNEDIPLIYFDAEKKEYKGIISEIINILSEKTGMTFNLIKQENGESLVDCLLNPDIDLILPTSSVENYDVEMFSTNTLMPLKIAFATLEDTYLSHDENVTVGVPKRMIATMRGLQKRFPNYVFKIFASDNECLKALKNREIDAIAHNTYVLGHLMLSPFYENVKIVQESAVEMPLCLGGNDQKSPLQSVLNKGIRQISHQEINDIVNKYTIYVKPEMTFLEVLYKNRGMIVTIVLFFAVVVVSLVVYIGLRGRFYAEINQKNKQLKEADTSRSNFFSRLSHDMRTPMNAIIGLSAIEAGENVSNEELKENLAKINVSGGYLLGLINDVLDMSKIESGKMQLNSTVLKFFDGLDGIEYVLLDRVKEKSIQYEVVKKGEFPKYINIDKMRLQQILINLLSNAIKFSYYGGKVELIIEAKKTEGKIFNCEIRVKDYGRGISPNFMPKVFLPFEQERSSEFNNTGTGLGLSIVKSLVALMGGKISVESELNKGTEFIIEMPFEICEELPSDSKEPNVMPQIVGCKILIAEDQPLNVEVERKLLQKKGCEIFVAENGQVAVNTFKESSVGFFDLILMDIRMPIMDGFIATREIRALDRADAKKIPIIAMTANAFDDDIQKSKEAGMNGHLSKPIDVSKFYGLIFSEITKSRDK